MSRYRLSLVALAAAPLALIAAAALLAPRIAGAQGNPFRFDVPAPEITGGRWLNTPENKPLTLASRRGKVTVLHFWTFG